MCLEVRKLRHKKLFKKGYFAVTARKDIKVYKVLEHTLEGYKTPYMKCHVQFENGECQTHCYDKHAFQLVTIETGIKSACGYHAYTNELRAFELISEMRERDLQSAFNMRVFEATIPAGSLVYYGKDSDICANQLIIHDTFDKEGFIRRISGGFYGFYKTA